eukprot:CAMPEP_0169280084 /NCGR_PEP_ID=MMETSP1016-20121227/55392_1 /TAXON_ID=342587 /ORGANISM="Karlodinium micrum, Strain CCMP2283" /LENGTH=547 /DNA_ID=CAMNT_0009368333 /DNA_START=62 /DNA_END=1707 /DNA_ORIENTATION=-
MACGDGPSSFEERMNALRNRVESWKSTRASTDGVTPMKLRGAYEASQWPPTPDFRARTEFAEKEEFFSKLSPPAEDHPLLASGGRQSRRSPSPKSKSGTPSSPGLGASPSRASTAKPDPFDAEMVRLEQRMRSWQSQSRSPVKAVSSSPTRANQSQIDNWNSRVGTPSSRTCGDAADRGTRSSSPCSSRSPNFISGRLGEANSPYYKIGCHYKDLRLLPANSCHHLVRSRLAWPLEDAPVNSRRGSLDSVRAGAKAMSRRGSSPSMLDCRRESTSPPPTSSSPSRPREGSDRARSSLSSRSVPLDSVRTSIDLHSSRPHAPNVFQKAQVESRGISPNGTPAYNVSAYLQRRSSWSPSSTSRSVESCNLQMRHGSEGQLSQRVAHLEDSMHNIEHMLSCLVRNVAGIQKQPLSQAGAKDTYEACEQFLRRQRQLRGLRAVSEEVHEEVRRYHRHALEPSAADHIRQAKSQGLYRHDRSTGKLRRSSNDRRKPWSCDVPAVMEAAELDASPNGTLLEAPRSRFRWPMNLKAAKEELRIEVQESLAARQL